MTIAQQLAALVADARAHGLTVIDLAALERLLDARKHRPDLVRRDDMLIVGLDDT